MPKRGMRSQEGPPFLFSFIWLAYLLFPITSILQQPFQERIIGFTLLVIFALIYLYSFRYRRGRLLTILGQIAIVGFFAYRYDINFLFLAFYPSPIIGSLVELRQIAIAFAALLSMFTFIGWYHHLLTDTNEMLQLMPALLVMLLLPVMMRIGRRSSELKNKLNVANEEIARLSKNEERQRISRDLHDTLGHTLSLITLKSELAEKLIAKHPDKAAQELRDVQMTSRAALKQVRQLISGMNAVTVRDEISHAKQILAAAGMKLDWKDHLTESNAAPPPLIDNILGMCLREAVTNVVKHSRARLCSVDWKETPDVFLLTVADDGIGADASTCSADTTKNGLNGMRERLKLVEGKLAFESAAGRGTHVTFTVPLVNKSMETEVQNL
jgi:two-component system, NarL family, sensor histidine kinase DesK